MKAEKGGGLHELPVALVDDVEVEGPIGDGVGDDARAEAFGADEEDAHHESVENSFGPLRAVIKAEGEAHGEEAEPGEGADGDVFEASAADEGRMRKSRKKSSSMTGTTRVGPTILMQR